MQIDNQTEDISFKKISEVFNTVETTRANYDEKRRLIEEFRTKPFDELKSRVHEKQRQTDQRIEQLLNVLYLSKEKLPLKTTNSTSNGSLSTPSATSTKVQTTTFNYPELFTY